MMSYVQIQRTPARAGLAGLGCVGCAGAGTPACSSCSRARGLGFASTGGSSFDLSSFDWKTWALIALAAVLVYQYLFGEKASKRRRALAQARAKYKGDVARIRAEA